MNIKSRFFSTTRKRVCSSLFLLFLILISLCGWYQVSEDFRFFICKNLGPEDKRKFCIQNSWRSDDSTMGQEIRLREARKKIQELEDIKK